MSQPKRLLTRLLPPTVLLLLPCLLLWRVVFLHEAFVPADLLRDVAPWHTTGAPAPIPWNPLMWDGVAEFYPWRLFAAEALRQGWLPLWNPHQFCGTPFVANSQSAVFYPPNALLFIPLPTQTAFGVSALVHLALTGLFLYGFLRAPALGLCRSAALLGAVVWQMSAWQVCWLALPTFLCVSAWLPLALWLTDRWAVRPSPSRATALGLCLGVILLAGHLQIALYCFLLVVAYALFRSLPRLREHRADALPLLGTGILALAVMAAVAAPQLLPAIELSRMSHRAGSPVNWSGYEGYVRLALPAVNLVTLFLPQFFGNPTQGTYWGIGTNGGPSAYIENTCYVGLLGLLLAFAGAALTWRTQSATRFFAVAALVALLLALGTPLDALLFFGIPGFAQSGSPGRILVLWTFSAAVLAAVGANTLASRRAARPLLATLGGFALVFAVSLGFTVFWIGRNAPPGTLQTNLARESDLWRLPAGILLGVLAAFVLRKRGTLSAGAFRASLVGLAAADLLAANFGFNRSTRAENVYPETPAITFLQRNADNERVMPLNRRWSLYDAPAAVLPPNAATVYGLLDTQGYDSLLTGQYIRWAAALDGGPPAPQENGNMVFTYGAQSAKSSLAAARYFVSRGPLPSPPPTLRLAFQNGETFIYENTTVLPRARVVNAHGTATLEDIAPTRVRIQVHSPDPTGDLVVADQWYPGWTAASEGRAVEMREGPDVFRTAHWTAQNAQADGGSRTIEMQYAPTSIRLGVYGLCLALGWTGAVVFLRLRQGWRG